MVLGWVVPPSIIGLVIIAYRLIWLEWRYGTVEPPRVNVGHLCQCSHGPHGDNPTLEVDDAR